MLLYFACCNNFTIIVSSFSAFIVKYVIDSLYANNKQEKNCILMQI